LLFQLKELKSGEIIQCGAKDRFKRRKKFAPLANIGKTTKETSSQPGSIFYVDSSSSGEDDVGYDDKVTFQRGTLNQIRIKYEPARNVLNQMHGGDTVLQNVKDKTVSPNVSTNCPIRRKSSDKQQMPVNYVQEDVNGNDVIKRDRIIPPSPSYPPPPLPDHALEAMKHREQK